MSCCGESVSKAQDVQSRAANPYPLAPVTSQPNGQPTLQPPQSFQQPALTTPPTAYGPPQPQQHYGQNGNVAQWVQSTTTASPPPQTAPLPQQFTGYSQSTHTNSPPPPLSPFGNMTDSIARPPSVFTGASSPPPMSTSPPLPMAVPSGFQQSVDEGRMSVSIDFGERWRSHGQEGSS